MALPLPVIRQRFFDNNGEPLAGGKVYTYEAGTTTPRSTKKDKAGVEDNTNPIILDSAGYCDIWLQTGSYKFVLKDASDATIWTQDNIQSLSDILNDEGALAVNNNLSDLEDVTEALTNLGLQNVDNTSDLNKPISTATQAALDAKVGHSTLTASRVPVTGSGNTISSSPVTSTELGYLAGVTSSIQTQLNSLGGNLSVTSKTANYTATTSDDVILCDASGGAFTITFYSASGNTGKQIRIKKTDSSFNAVTLSGPTSSLNTQGESVVYVSDGTNWQLISRAIPSIRTSYTPTVVGAGTVSDNVAYYDRRGTNLVVNAHFTAGTPSGSTATFSLPSGLTGNSGIGFPIVLGRMYRDTTNTSNVKDLSVVAGTGDITTVNFSFPEYALGFSPIASQLGNVVFVSGNFYFIEFSIRIVGWN